MIIYVSYGEPLKSPHAVPQMSPPHGGGGNQKSPQSLLVSPIGIPILRGYWKQCKGDVSSDDVCSVYSRRSRVNVRLQMISWWHRGKPRTSGRLRRLETEEQNLIQVGRNSVDHQTTKIRKKRILPSHATESWEGTKRLDLSSSSCVRKLSMNTLWRKCSPFTQGGSIF